MSGDDTEMLRTLIAAASVGTMQAVAQWSRTGQLTPWQVRAILRNAQAVDRGCELLAEWDAAHTIGTAPGEVRG